MANPNARQRQLAANPASAASPVGLDPTSPTPIRIEGLLRLGLEVEELAEALDVTPATVRNWIRGSAVPRRGPARTIDDLRRIAVVLSEAGVKGADAAQWLRSRQGGPLEGDRRPLDVVREDPVQVLASAHGVVIGEDSEQDADFGVVAH